MPSKLNRLGDVYDCVCVCVCVRVCVRTCVCVCSCEKGIIIIQFLKAHNKHSLHGDDAVSPHCQDKDTNKTDDTLTRLMRGHTSL